MIADSSDSTKLRGRRGLDILNKIQKQSYVNVVISDSDYPAIKEVDQKLISMAKETGEPNNNQRFQPQQGGRGAFHSGAQYQSVGECPETDRFLGRTSGHK